MRPLRILATLAVCLLTAASHADEPFIAPTPADLALKDVPFAPGAAAVVLDWSVDRNDEKSFETEHIRIKVLTEAGKKLADVELPYVRKKSSIRDLRARTVQPDGTATLFVGRPFEKLIVKARRTDVMAATFTLPDVRVGSILEYSYTRRWSRGGSDLAFWEMQRDIPMLHAHVAFRPFQNIPYSVMYAANALPVAPQFLKDHWDIELHDVAPFEEEPLSPPAALVKPYLIFFYSLAGQNAAAHWGTIAASLSHIFEDRMEQTPAIVAAATETTAGGTTPEEKLRRIYTRMQKLRNVAFEREKTEDEKKRENLAENKSVTDVLKNGFGGVDDINTTFIALARAAGFEAEPVFLTDRGAPFSREIASASQLHHLAATVRIDGVRKYYDPAVPFLPFGMLRWDNAYTIALVVPKKGAPVWVQTPDVPATASATKRTAVLHVDGEAISGVLHVEWTGESALKYRLDLRHDDETQQKKTIEDDVKKWFPAGASVKLTRLTGMTGSDEPLLADVDVSVPNVVSYTASRALVPLSIFEAKSPFSAGQRKQPIFLDYEYEIADFITLKVPDGYKLESLPDAVKYDIGALKYWSESKRGDGTFSFSRRLEFDTAYITEDRYPALRKFMSDVVVADQVSASLLKQ